MTRLPDYIIDSKTSLNPFTPLFLTIVLVTAIITIVSILCVVRKETPVPVVVPTITPTPSIAPTPSVLRFRGEASYYSREGCLGCSETLTMANGETLDDDRLTIAMTPETVRKYKLLNKVVTIRNVSTNYATNAKVTDTGGFGKYARIADMSVAVKRSLRCGGLCEVEITVE